MNNKEYVAEVVKGITQAFDLEVIGDEIEASLYEFDPLSDGWSLGIGGDDDLFKICGQPVEMVFTCPTQTPETVALPCGMLIQILGGKPAAEDCDRAHGLIEELAGSLGSQIVTNDVSEDDALILNFNATIHAPEDVSKAIVDVVEKLEKGKHAKLTEELLELCSK